MRDLSARLLQAQDEERRRIARELHDSVGQLVAAISMNLSAVREQSDRLDAKGAKAVAETIVLVEEIEREIRTISHLLHPPLLDEIGLLPAIKLFATGFAERSKIDVAVDLAPEIGRLSPTAEISIFRVVQECLSNVYRHSESKTAFIKMWPVDHKTLNLVVRDEGRGMPPHHPLFQTNGTKQGVGLSGMRERLRELGGTLEIRSDQNGTTVTAAVPLSDGVVSA